MNSFPWLIGNCIQALWVDAWPHSRDICTDYQRSNFWVHTCICNLEPEIVATLRIKIFVVRLVRKKGIAHF